MAEKLKYSAFNDETQEFIALLNRVMADIALRLGGIEEIGDDLKEIEQRYGVTALERIDALLTPLVAAMQQAVADAQAQLEGLESGTATNSLQLGAQLPAFYLALVNAVGVLDVANGGTGGTTPGEARTALEVTPANIGTMTTVEINAAITASVDGLVDGAPGALNVLSELAAAMGNDPNFATTVTNALAAKLNASIYTAADVLAKVLASGGMATTAHFLTGAADKLLSADEVWDAVEPVALADDATVTVDLNTGTNFTLTLVANRTISFSNTGLKKNFMIEFTQDGAGNRQPAVDGTGTFGDAGVPDHQTGAGKKDYWFGTVSPSGLVLLSFWKGA